jgi:hypothetical protein
MSQALGWACPTLSNAPFQRSSRTRRVGMARRVKEVHIVIAPGNGDSVQRQRVGRELVRDINTKLQGEGVVAARRLPSGDVLVTF